MSIADPTPKAVKLMRHYNRIAQDPDYRVAFNQFRECAKTAKEVIDQKSPAMQGSIHIPFNEPDKRDIFMPEIIHYIGQDRALWHLEDSLYSPEGEINPDGWKTILRQCKVIVTILDRAITHEAVTDMARAKSTLEGIRQSFSQLEAILVAEFKGAAEKPLPRSGKQMVLTRHEQSGELFLNGTPYIKPYSGGIADRLMEVLQPGEIPQNKELNEEEIMKVKKGEQKPISKVVTDLGFKGEMREKFFGSISDKKVKFVNPIWIDEPENTTGQ